MNGRGRGRRLGARLLVGLALAAGLLVALGEPAAAHASLLSVDPPDGARLERSPETVTLTFSERVSADLGGVRVLDATGAQVQVGAAEVSDATVTVALAPDLPDGTYAVSYRVVSADGHPVRGGSIFGVGSGPLDEGALARATSGGDDRLWEVVGGVGRGAAYAGALLAAGGALFLVLVHRGGAERRALARGVRLAALLGAVATLVALPVQAALGTGQGPGSLVDPGVLGSVTADGVGHGLLLCLVGLLLVVLAVERSTPGTVVGSLVAAASFAAAGHNRVGDAALLATAADGVHLVAGALWGGGLVSLWWALRLRRRAGEADPVEDGRLVARFSRLATAAVGPVVVAGVVLSWSQVRAIGALTDTGYGLFIVAKVATVAAVGVVGAYNHYRLVPALLRTTASRAMARLRLTLRLEALGLVGVVALSSVLVVLTPAKASLERGVVEEIVQLGDAGSVQLVVDPARAGFNEIHLYTYDPSGRPAEIGQAVSLELELPAAELGPIDRAAVRAGPAHYQLDGSDLSVAGRWTVTVRVRVDRFTEAAGTVEVEVAA